MKQVASFPLEKAISSGLLETPGEARRLKTDQSLEQTCRMDQVPHSKTPVSFCEGGFL